MNRGAEDPSAAAPTVSCFLVENSISISWPPDPNADSYILERADDAASPVYSTMYSGVGLEYVDGSCLDQGRYLYRLSRLRGGCRFGPSVSVLGVASAVCRDALEPNDDEGRATALNYDRAANLHCYSSEFKQNGVHLVLEDADWYSVTVPPRRNANIVLTQEGLAEGSAATWMYFYQKGQNPHQVVNNSAIPIVNSSYETTTFLFKIFPVPACFAVNGGGSTIDYRVSLNSITSN
jgi:hypothetical protein